MLSTLNEYEMDFLDTYEAFIPYATFNDVSLDQATLLIGAISATKGMFKIAAAVSAYIQSLFNAQTLEKQQAQEISKNNELDKKRFDWLMNSSNDLIIGSVCLGLYYTLSDLDRFATKCRNFCYKAYWFKH